MKKANGIQVRAKVQIPLDGFPQATFITFDGFAKNEEHFVIVFGNPNVTSPLIRIHSECITGDLFGSLRCDCGNQLQESICKFKKEAGILIYLRQEGRGIGLNSKLDAYLLQSKGMDTFEANVALGHDEDGRDFEPAAAMLKAMSIERVKLLTNNPKKSEALMANGIAVDTVMSTGTFVTPFNRDYLRAKSAKHKHLLAAELLLV